MLPYKFKSNYQKKKKQYLDNNISDSTVSAYVVANGQPVVNEIVANGLHD